MELADEAPFILDYIALHPNYLLKLADCLTDGETALQVTG